MTVHNLVVVRELEIEFAHGLTVLSGETGAGKSIIIEALGLALGERADLGLLRAGAERATVSARFDLERLPVVQAFLRAHELDGDGECVLRRVLGRDGRTRAFCNASPIPLSLLRTLGRMLVDVHAQHAGLRLLDRDTQRQLLDAFGDLGDQVEAVAEAHATWRAAATALDLAARTGLNAERLALLRYQVEELAAAQLESTDLDRLSDEHRRLAHATGNLEHCAALRATLTGDEAGALDQLRAGAARARLLVRHAPEGLALQQALDQAVLCAEEAAHELDRLEQAIDIDPARLAALDQRLAELHALARKHQIAMQELPALATRLHAELAGYEQHDQQLETLRQALNSAAADYAAVAASLSSARREAAERMHSAISERLRTLGIPHGLFAVTITPADDGAPQAHGRDRVEFVVSTNPDQPPGPLAKVASGGELSRIALAIQAETAGLAGVPVVVYDEVDSGIGGTTANIVGQRLREVARHCQVICITHSPQVASAGDHHLRVSKRVHQGSTESVVEALAGRMREEEIARMLGAAAATRPSLAHARDLMAAAQRGS